VVENRIGLGQLVTLPLLGDHVQELRPLQLLQVLQGGDQRFEVVAVDRADVVETQFLEQGAGRQHALDVLLGAFGELEQRRRKVENFLACLARGVEAAAGEEACQVAVEGTDGRRDRHVVIVEDDEHVGVGDAGIVQRLEGLAGGHRAIADDRHDLRGSPLILAASAMPSAAEIEVDE
jgi:hypothetical protein